MRHVWMFAVPLVLGSLSAYQQRGAGGTSEMSQFVIGDAMAPEKLDPHSISNTAEGRVATALFEGLVILSPKNDKVLPGVAKRWVSNKRGDLYTFFLRRSTWSDGTPVTAQTFRDSWIRSISGRENSSLCADFPALLLKGGQAFREGLTDEAGVAVRVVGPWTLEVSLAEPLPHGVDVFAHSSFSPVPLHSIKKHRKKWTRPGRIVSNGAFRLVDWTPKGPLVLSPNPFYWDKSSVKLSRIVFLPVEDSLNALRAYDAGAIDWLTNDFRKEILEKHKGRGDLHISPIPEIYSLYFNSKKLLLNEKIIRKALTLSIDTKALSQKISTGFITHALPSQKRAPYDPETARKLLAKAGYPGGMGFPPLTILHETDALSQKIAKLAQQQWLKILNIETSLSEQNRLTFFRRWRRKNFEIVLSRKKRNFKSLSNSLRISPTKNSFRNWWSSLNDVDFFEGSESLLSSDKDKYPSPATEETFLAIPLLSASSAKVNMIDTTEWIGWYPNAEDTHPLKFIFRQRTTPN